MNQNKKELHVFLRLLGSLSICYALLSFDFAASAENSRRPNVLFILADDLGYGDLACYGNKLIDTAAIDSLAESGVRLTNYYAPSPLCAPSRAAILTGRYNHRTGAVDVPSNRGLDRLAPDELTFGDYFSSAGYATALIGKWHNGLYSQNQLPHHRGFESFVGFPNGGQDYWNWNMLKNDQPFPADGRYLSDALNDETIRLIDEAIASDRPFAIFLAHLTPHQPFQAPQKLVSKYRNRLRSDVAEQVPTIYAMIEAMDRGLARVFDHLKKSRLWEDTIIVFSSDNGAYLSKATQRYASGFSGNKGDVGEQGVRVPAIVSWPSQIPGNTAINVPIHGCDWLPTLYHLTGAPRPPESPPFDGQNTFAILCGTESSPASRPLYFQKNRYRPHQFSDAAIREGKWKLTWPGIPETMRKQSGRDNPSYQRGLTSPHWEMPLDRDLADWPDYPTPKLRLYDLERDPSESHDLSEEHPELVVALKEKYQQWFAEMMKDWEVSRAQILEEDRAYWSSRVAPDPKILFSEFWQWQHAPQGSREDGADPTSIFRGYWNQEDQRSPP